MIDSIIDRLDGCAAFAIAILLGVGLGLAALNVILP